MKKVKMRVLSSAAALLLLATSTACNGDNSQTGTSSATQASGTTSASEQAPVNLSIEGLFSIKEDGEQSDPVSKYITEKTGVTLNISNLGDSNNDKLSAQIAGNDLPDLFPTPATTTLKKMIEADEIVPLDDLAAKYGKTLNSDNLAKAMIKSNQLTSPDGKLYSIGMCRGTWDDGVNPVRALYIRWDLYKKLGYPPIKSLDDLANVLIQMQKLEPKTKDGKKTYALGSSVDSYEFTCCVGYWRTCGFCDGADKLQYLDIETGKPASENLLTTKDSLFWQGFKFANKLNQAGVFDPDSFTQTTQYADKVKTGTYMLLPEGWNATDANKKFKEDGTPEKGYVALPASMFGYSNYMLYGNNIPGERQFSIAKTCKNPERAMQLLDFVSSYEFSRIANNGLEGTNWTMKDGKPTPTEAYLNMSSDDVAKTGAGVYDHFCGYESGTIDPTTKTTVDCTKNVLPLTSYQKDFIQHFGEKTMTDVYKKNVKTYENNVLVDWGTLDDDMKTYETNLVTYMRQGETKAILAKNDAEFEKVQDSFIQGLSSYKEDEIFKFYTDAANNSLKKMQPVYDMLK